MAAQFEQDMLNTISTRYHPLTLKFVDFLILSSECSKTLKGLYSRPEQYHDLYTVLTREFMADPSKYPSVMPAYDGNPESCREFYSKCDAIFALPSTNGRNVILKYLAAAAATQFMMYFELLACGKVGYTMANIGNDIASVRLLGHDRFNELKRLQKGLGNRGQRFGFVGEKIRYKDRRTSQVREATVLDAGSSVAEGDYYRIQDSEGQQSTIAMDEVILTD